MEAAKPKCPGCGVEGLGNIAIQPAPGNKNILIASCGECGIIHSVFSRPFEQQKGRQPNPVEFL